MRIPTPLFAVLSLFVCGLTFAADTSTPAYSFKRGVNISHWLSQNFPSRPYAAPWYDQEDVAWIAKQGFDHIRYPIDGREWRKADGSLDEAKIVPFEKALQWTKAQGLGVVLDMHFLPGASFDPTHLDAAVFTDEKLQVEVAGFWRQVAKRFSGEGPWLRFEILNEPVATDNRHLNPFNARMLAAIRESNPTRVVYFTTNRWGGFDTIQDLVLPDDPNVAITLHYYNPMVFTHQRASWVKFPEDMPLITFPGRVPDISQLKLPDDHFARSASGTELTIATIDADFAKVAAWVAQNAPGREVYLGEFGVYEPADADSKRTYVRTIVNAAQRHGWGWAVWDYQGGFAIRDAAGQPTSILEGLFPPGK